MTAGAVSFRSSGGPDEPWNGVALCAVHHLHGIHLGYLEVTGRAGERLHWRFATGEAAPTEEWETLGDDDVWRRGIAGSAPAEAAGGPGAGAAPGERGRPGRGGVTDVESAGARRGAGGVTAPRDPGATDVEPVAAAAGAIFQRADVTDVERRASAGHGKPDPGEATPEPDVVSEAASPA
ncbi:MAG TPA: hypothetical protein VFY93_14915, partial [Planctomycetota bacterium]|nr:hypothetical protein [Planctomycetota bacterium]